jgi:hypothetical protein
MPLFHNAKTSMEKMAWLDNRPATAAHGAGFKDIANAPRLALRSPWRPGRSAFKIILA